MAALLRSLVALLTGTVLGPIPVAAHPHEFVDTGITFHFDDADLLGAVSVVWLYDDLTSLLILEDLGMVSDGDGRLTNDETVRLVQMAGSWPTDFDGNLVLMHEGQSVSLSGPLEATAGLRDGRLYITHPRALTQRLDFLSDEITLQAYDPSYYTFYDLRGEPGIVGRQGCKVSIEAPDIALAQKLYDAALAELTDEELMEHGKFPEIGGAFAATLRLTCGL